MSGGVDSSTSAALLLEQGYDVIGVTLKLWKHDCLSFDEDQFKCCGSRAASDVRAVCDHLGIPFHLMDGSEAFEKDVVSPFADEYRAGRTPNPCILCNEYVKFNMLLRCADELGAQHVATGHYARVEHVNGRTLLKRGCDPRKDQSYFLFSLCQRQLSRVLFPVGRLTKVGTREAARDRHLKTAAKKESMEICFVPDNDYGKFLQRSGLAQKHPGEIVDLRGRVLGRHNGIEFYTIGQRRGLGITTPKPVYVIELDAANNRVVVGDDATLDRDEFTVERCNWIPFDELAQPIEVTTKIRYNHPGTAATVTPAGQGVAKVKLHVPQRAITPGQAAVFYQDDVVVGGGWITR